MKDDQNTHLILEKEILQGLQYIGLGLLLSWAVVADKKQCREIWWEIWIGFSSQIVRIQPKIPDSIIDRKGLESNPWFEKERDR